MGDIIKNAKEKVKGKAKRISGRAQAWFVSHAGHSTPSLGVSCDSSPTRRPASVGGDSTTSLGLHSAENSGLQSPVALSGGSDAPIHLSDTTTAEFERVQIPQVTVSTPEDLAISVIPSHNPDQPPVGPPLPSPGALAADNRSTPPIPSTPDSLPTPPILAPAATGLGDTRGAAPGDVPVDALGDTPGDALGVKLPGPSATPPAAPSVPGESPPNAQENPPSGASSQASELSLWAKAFEKLSEDDKKAFPLTDTNKAPEVCTGDIRVATEVCIGDIRLATEKCRGICVVEKKKYAIRGKNIVVRDVADKILAWLEKFKEIGDCAMQYDPVHAALPWAAVRFLLQIALNHKETMEAVLIGVERITRSLVRCDLYERLYLQPGLGLSVCKSLEDVLVGFYLAVLEFLAFAKQYLGKSSPARVFHGLLEVDGKSVFITIDEREKWVLSEVQAAETELRRRDHYDLEHKTLSTIEDRHNTLKHILEEMEKPIKRIDLAVGQLQGDIKIYIEAEKRNKILQWISGVEYEMDHRNARENLLTNTGLWLFDKEEFREWRTSSFSGILWLHGIPGAGKTKLVCAVIDYLESTGQTYEPVVYFYCNKNEKQRRDPTIIMQALVKQLVVALQPRSPNPVAAVYDEREDGGFAAGPLGFKESCGLLRSLLDLYAHTTIIIDALDEANPGTRSELLEELKTIISSSNCLVKIFISSRDDVDIKLKLEEVPNLYIKAKDTKGDIDRFVDREVGQSIENRQLLLGNVTDELKELIISAIVGKAGGMFQWAALQIMHLCSMEFEKDVRASLGELPLTLEAAYNQTWSDILSKKRYALEITRRALMWVMCALMPLNEELWANASYWPEPVPTGGVLTLFKLCRNLVTSDKERGIVVFAHLSVREYLEAKVFTSVDAHSMAAESCLSFFDDARNVSALIGTIGHDRSSGVPQFPPYTVCCWDEHCQYIFDEGEMSEATKNVLRRFLGTPASPGQGYSNFVTLCSNPEIDDRFFSSIPPNPLFALACFPFVTELNDLWEFKGVDINCKNQDDQSVLFVAVMSDNVWAMDTLLAKGAKVDVGNRKNTDLLIDAVKRKEAGASILLTGYAGIKITASVLIAAIEGSGYIDSRYGIKIVEMLLNKCTGTEITPAVLIATAGRKTDGPSIAKMLLTKCTSIAITTEVLIALAKKKYSSSVMEVFLARCTGGEITAAVLIAAIKNSACGDKLVRMLLDKCSATEITTEVLVAAVGTRDDTPWAMYALLAECDCIQITEVVLIMAMRNERNWYYGDYRLIKILLDKSINTKITEAVMVEAVRMRESKVLESLIDAGATVTEAVLVEAAGNYHHGPKMLDLLFARDAGIKITAEVLIAVIGVPYYNHKLLKLMFTKCADAELTEEVLRAAVSCQGACDTINMLLARDASCRITEDVLIAAAGNRSCSYQVMWILCAKGAGTLITEKVLIAAAQTCIETMQMLLGKSAVSQITEKVLIAATQNWTGGTKTMRMLLEKCDDTLITEWVLIGAVEKWDWCHGPQAVEILLTKCADTPITEEVLIAAAGNWNYGLQIMEILLTKCAGTLITEEVLIAAAGNWNDGPQIMEILLTKCAGTLITEGVLIAAAGDTACGHQVVEILLTKCAGTLITEEVLIAAAGNRHYGPQIVRILLTKCADTLITEEVLIAAAGNWYYGPQVVEILLTQCADTLITEEVLIAAAGNRHHSSQVVRILLTKCADTLITEEVLIAAAGNWYDGSQVVEILLTKCDDTQVTDMAMASPVGGTSGEKVQKVLRPRASKILITESVLVVAVARYGGLNLPKLLLLRYTNMLITEGIFMAAADSYDILQCLLCRGYEIPITEAVVVAAAKASKATKIIPLLLLMNAEIPITEAVLAAAVGRTSDNRVEKTDRVELLNILLSRDPDIPITEAVLVAAAQGVRDWRVLEFLISTGRDIPITEAVMVAAAGGLWGPRFLRFLLSRDPDIPITEAVVVAAVRSFHRREALIFLRSGVCDIPITEAVVVAAAGREYQGREILQLLISMYPDIPITTTVIAAAAAVMNGWDMDSSTLQWLLHKYPYIQVTEEVVVAAVGGVYGPDTLRFLWSKHPDIPITEAVWVAAMGNKKRDNLMELIRLLAARVTSMTITDKIKEAAAAQGPYFCKRIMWNLRAKEAKLQSSPSHPMLQRSESIHDAEHPTEEALGAT